MGDKIEYRDKSDINSEFYTHNRPDLHTPERIREKRENYKYILTGRITDEELNEMVELSVEFPENHVITTDDFKKLEGDSIWTLSPRKGNYDDELQTYTDKSSRFYFLNSMNEYTSDIEPNEGFLCIEQVHTSTDSTMTAIGNFEFNLREFGGSTRAKARGDFNLEFYIGL